MKSIRRNLTIWLLSGLALILFLAGTGIYYAVESSLIKAVDAELAVDARALRFLGKSDNEPPPGRGPGGRRGPPGRRPQPKPAAYNNAGGGSFYQTWSLGGGEDEKSVSLGDRNLPQPEKPRSEPTFSNAQLDDGTPVRLISFRVAPGGKGRPKGERRRAENASLVVIGRDMQDAENTLSTLLGGLVAVGFIAGLGAFLLVGTAVNRGLKPLRNLGSQTRDIDSNSLDARFDATGAPAELQPVYERLNDLLARIESSFERERRFSSDLAHEMRTPVAELKMLSEVALKWPDRADENTHRETLEIATQLESMIENLLALARWESGELQLKNEEVSLKPAAERSWEPHAGRAHEKQLDVHFDIEENATLQTDSGMLRHILDNLLSNAVEYTHEGGRIEVSGQSGELEVANSANGVGEEDVAHFFDRYWRQDTARGDSAHAGLGLSLAKACAGALDMSLSARLDGPYIRFTLKPEEKLSAA